MQDRLRSTKDWEMHIDDGNLHMGHNLLRTDNALSVHTARLRI